MWPFRRIEVAFSSSLLRLLAFVFFRWIPGHPFPPLIYSTFAIYAVGFIACAKRKVTNASHVREEKFANGHIHDKNLTASFTDNPRVVKTLLTGLPSPTSIITSALTFTINCTIVLAVAYYVYAPSLIYPAHDLSVARVGYVSAESAKIFLREPDPLQLPISLSYRYADSSDAESGPRRQFSLAWKPVETINSLTNATDFTATFTISNLVPDTRYQYAFSNGHNGFFITAPPIGTFSQRGNGKFTFLHTSCIIQNFPFHPGAHPLSVHGFRHLSGWLSKLRPAFMLFLGDFIYADVPARHGADVQAYRTLYRHVYASPDWPSVAKTAPEHTSYDGRDYDLPWIHTYDDHEIANDWSKNTTGYFSAAFDPYMHYHLGPNPPLPQSQPSYPRALHEGTPSALALANHPPTYSSFIQGPASFFLIDTRRYRQPPSTHGNSSMLGSAQLDALLEWIAQPLPSGVSWKILVSSVPFTKNWRVNALDTWRGYPVERRKILEAMWSYKASFGRAAAGLVILSGDRHEFAATAFPQPSRHGVEKGLGSGPVAGSAADVIEFSTSPLSQFYLPIRTYKQDAPPPALSSPLPQSGDSSNSELKAEEEDICVKYIPEGNSKFGLIEIEPRTGSGVSLLRYRLFIDGEEAWSHIVSAGGPVTVGDADNTRSRKSGIRERWKEGIWE